MSNRRRKGPPDRPTAKERARQARYGRTAKPPHEQSAEAEVAPDPKGPGDPFAAPAHSESTEGADTSETDGQPPQPEVTPRTSPTPKAEPEVEAASDPTATEDHLKVIARAEQAIAALIDSRARFEGALALAIQKLDSAEQLHLERASQHAQDFARRLDALTRETEDWANRERDIAFREASARLDKALITGQEAALREKLRWQEEQHTAEVSELRERLRAANQSLTELTLEAQRLRVTEPQLQATEQELRNLREANRELLEQLEGLKSEHATGVDPNLLLKENRALKNDLEAARSEKVALEQRLRDGDAAIDSLTRVQDSLMALTAEKEAYRLQVAELRDSFDELTDKKRNRTPFPKAAEIKERAGSRSPSKISTTAVPLKELGAFVRGAMESANSPRMYSERDIAFFFGGLAASRLLILQGVSGTGKTSLPLAVAAALGWPWHVIEVASGWRDPQDLVGYYNAFDHRYHETKFFNAIYEASMPSNQDLPRLVVLDEMNLSQPEHYFSDLLSTMWQDAQEPRIDLRLPGDLPGVPEPIQDGSLVVPSSVWFIGTSNRDESTLSIADKTHDRAHVMELPRAHPKATGVKSDAPGSLPVGCTALRAAFRQARKDHHGQAEECVASFNVLAENLAPYGVSWGNRLPEMLRELVPVYLEMTEEVSGAWDEIVCRKVLRKVEANYRLDSTHLEYIRMCIEDEWKKFGQGQPSRWDAELTNIRSMRN